MCGYLWTPLHCPKTHGNRSPDVERAKALSAQPCRVASAEDEPRSITSVNHGNIRVPPPTPVLLRQFYNHSAQRSGKDTRRYDNTECNSL